MIKQQQRCYFIKCLVQERKEQIFDNFLQRNNPILKGRVLKNKAKCVQLGYRSV